MDNDDVFEPFRIKHNGVTPKKGAILLSVPLLRDRYFKKTVVYLTEHNSEGSIGFIINKPLDFELHQLLDGIPESSIKVFYGGPVANDTIHIIHNMGDRILRSKRIVGDLYWGGDFEQVKFLLRSDISLGRNFRFFLGYSGWDPGQLQQEISNDTWLVTSIDIPDLFGDGRAPQWESILEKMGGKYKLWTQFPEDSAFN